MQNVPFRFSVLGLLAALTEADLFTGAGFSSTATAKENQLSVSFFGLRFFDLHRTRLKKERKVKAAYPSAFCFATPVPFLVKIAYKTDQLIVEGRKGSKDREKSKEQWRLEIQFGVVGAL